MSSLICPDTTTICDTSLVAPAFTTLAEFKAGGGSVVNEANIDAGTFLLFSETVTPTMVTRVYVVNDLCRYPLQCTQVILIEGPCITIPTMSQWALFLFGLIVFTLFVVGVYNVKFSMET